MLFQWFMLDSPSLWIFAYFPQHGFNGLCSFLSTATLSTIDSRRRWLVLGAGGFALISYYWSLFAIGLVAGSFLLLMALPIAAERLYPLPDRKNHFHDRDKRSIYIAVGCILVSVTGEAVSVCVAVAALIFGVVIPAVIRRKNLWEGLNPL